MGLMPAISRKWGARRVEPYFDRKWPEIPWETHRPGPELPVFRRRGGYAPCDGHEGVAPIVPGGDPCRYG